MKNFGIALLVLGIGCAGFVACGDSSATASKSALQFPKELYLNLGDNVMLKLALSPIRAEKF